MGCHTTFIVKNTFICAVEDEPSSPTCSISRRRSKTEGDYLSCLEPEAADPVCEAQAPTDRLVVLELALQAGDPTASSACAEIRKSAHTFAFDSAGSQLLEQALGLSDERFARDVAMMLQGLIPQAVCSQHAHKVVESLVPRLDVEACANIVNELLGHSSRLSMHAFGSSLLCRLFEHLPADTVVVALIDEVLSHDVTQLICHKFGHMVALSILRNGLPRHRSKLAEVLSGELQRFARHRFASLVLALALSQCIAKEAHGLAFALMGQAGAVSSLACHSFGYRVVKALLELPSAAEQVRFYLLKSSRRLQKDKFGVRLLDELSVSNPLVNDFVGCVGGA